MADDSDLTTFFVGDSDLVFLGLAAGLAARFQLRRKGGGGPGPQYPVNDIDAMELLLRGIRAAARFAADDVPRIRIAVHAEGPAINHLLAMAQQSAEDMETPDDDIPYDPEAIPPIEPLDDDEGDDWKREK